MKRHLFILLACCLVMVFLITSLAFAKSPKTPPGVSSDGLIYGCYKKINGQLRIVGGPGQCRPSELSIFWNQTGPPGPQGPPGPPPTLWITRQNPESPPVDLTGAGVQVLALNVPAGTYAISAKVSVANSSALVSAASCELSTGDTSSVVLGPGGTGNDDFQQVITLLDAAVFNADTTITLSCATSSGQALEGFLGALEVELPLQ